MNQRNGLFYSIFDPAIDMEFHRPDPPLRQALLPLHWVRQAVSGLRIWFSCPELPSPRTNCGTQKVPSILGHHRITPTPQSALWGWLRLCGFAITRLPPLSNANSALPSNPQTKLLKNPVSSVGFSHSNSSRNLVLSFFSHIHKVTQLKCPAVWSPSVPRILLGQVGTPWHSVPGPFGEEKSGTIQEKEGSGSS